MQNIYNHPLVLEMLEVIKKYHSTQFRNNGRVPYAQHCVSASEILNSALEKTGELNHDKDLHVAITCAVLGHDLFEDTDVERGYIKEHFGDIAFHLIEEVTNDMGDDNHEFYAQKLLHGSEESVLIKYGDFIENTISVAYGIPDLGYDWANTFYLPIMNGTEKVLSQKVFHKYPKTGELLRSQYQFSRERFLQNLGKYAPDQKWV